MLPASQIVCNRAAELGRKPRCPAVGDVGVKLIDYNQNVGVYGVILGVMEEKMKTAFSSQV